MRSDVLAFLLATLCLIPSCVSPMQVDVELDIFSGRPNPAWTLTSSDAQFVADALSSAEAAGSSSPEPHHLGYRGFIVRYVGGTARVYHGRILRSDNRGTRTLADTSYLEKRLSEHAVRRGLADLLPAALREP